MKKSGCSLAQGRRTKEDEDDMGLVAGHQERIEELLEGLGKKMDGIMEVLRVGLEKIAQKVEQGVDETHKHWKMEVMRKREAKRKWGESLKKWG